MEGYWLGDGFNLPLIPHGRLNVLLAPWEVVSLRGRSWWEGGLRFTEVRLCLLCIALDLSWSRKGYPWKRGL